MGRPDCWHSDSVTSSISSSPSQPYTPHTNTQFAKHGHKLWLGAKNGNWQLKEPGHLSSKTDGTLILPGGWFLLILRLTSFPPPPCWPLPPASWTLQPPGPPPPSPSASPRSGTAETNTVWVWVLSNSYLIVNKHFTTKSSCFVWDKSGFSVCENSLQSQISKYLSFKKSSLLQRWVTSIASISAFSVWADSPAFIAIIIVKPKSKSQSPCTNKPSTPNQVQPSSKNRDLDWHHHHINMSSWTHPHGSQGLTLLT